MKRATWPGTETVIAALFWRAPSSSIERSTCSAVDSVERTWPVPRQRRQISVEASNRLGRRRWRDSSSSPKGLMRDLVRRLQIGLERGLLDIALARGAARVDVDRDQRLGLVDDDVAAGAQLDDGIVNRVELALDLVAGEQRHGRVLVLLDPLGM